MATDRPRSPFTFPDQLTKEQWQQWADDVGKSLNTWMIMMIEKGIAASCDQENEQPVDVEEVISPDFVLELPVKVYSGSIRQLAINVAGSRDDSSSLKDDICKYESYIREKMNFSSAKMCLNALEDLTSEMLGKYGYDEQKRPDEINSLSKDIFMAKLDLRRGHTVGSAAVHFEFVDVISQDKKSDMYVDTEEKFEYRGVYCYWNKLSESWNVYRYRGWSPIMMNVKFSKTDLLGEIDKYLSGSDLEADDVELEDDTEV